MNVYSFDVKLCGTLYVKATSPSRAAAAAQDFLNKAELEFLSDGVLVSERPFDDPTLPDVSFSPIFTHHGLWDDFAEGGRLEAEGVPG